MGYPVGKLKSFKAHAAKDMAKYVQSAIVRVRGEIASAGAKAATSAGARKAMYDAIVAHMKELEAQMTASLTRMIDKTARAANAQAGEDTGGLVKYDPKRTERYLELADSGNAGRLAAVYTDKMSSSLIGGLRSAFVDEFRKHTVNGTAMSDFAKTLQSRLDAEAGKRSSFRFVDKAGRAWDTKHYIEMLARTNEERVWNDSYVDTLAEKGHRLARVSSGGDPDCKACRAWEGQIVCVAGKSDKYPSYEEARAAGLFHPNCTHHLEFIDEDADKEEIKLQASVPMPDDLGDAQAVQNRKDEIDIRRAMADAEIDHDDAKMAVMDDRIDEAIRQGLLSDEFADVPDYLDEETFAGMWDRGVPSFEPTKKGGTTAWHGDTLTVAPGTSAKELAGMLKAKYGQEDASGLRQGRRRKAGIARAKRERA